MSRRLWARPDDDRGTSLVLALIFITVGSLVLAAVLALADTGMRGTIQLSSEASATAAAEGAANVAINALRGGEFAGTGNCLGAGNRLELPDFYTRPDGTHDSARVTCDLDAARTIAPYGTPSRALLTLDQTATSGLNPPIGISVTNTLSLTTGNLRVAGDVVSNSNVVVQPKIPIVGGPSGNVTSTGTIRAARACSTGSGLFSPAATCNTGTPVADPRYPVPDVASLPNRTVPACAPVMTLQPGHYGSPNAGTAAAIAAALSALTSPFCQGGNGVLLFQPGIYYFEFAAPDVLVPISWTLTAGTVIGGALRAGVTPGPTMPVPNSCVSPVPTGTGPVTVSPEDGVTFVFSGGSFMSVAANARVELCGRYAGLKAPLAITAEQAAGSLAAICTNNGWPCAAVLTPLPVPPTAFVVQGTIYLPTRELVLTLTNSSNQDFRGGAVVRRFWANTSRTSTNPVIESPAEVNTQRRTVVWLNVYLCPGALSCPSPTGGVLSVRTKVSIVDPSGLPVAGSRQMSVLSWSLVA